MQHTTLQYTKDENASVALLSKVVNLTEHLRNFRLHTLLTRTHSSSLLTYSCCFVSKGQSLSRKNVKNPYCRYMF